MLKSLKEIMNKMRRETEDLNKTFRDLKNTIFEVKNEFQGLNNKLCVCSVVSDSATPQASSLPGSSAHGILQARLLEWVAIAFSRRSSRPRYQTRISCSSCIGRRVLYHWHHLGSPKNNVIRG